LATIENFDPMQTQSFILGKDASLESTIATLQGKLAALGFQVEERSWLNPIDGLEAYLMSNPIERLY
jgi:ribosomal protein S12 methylthiotransferase accessory factor YcaO